jgi:hypothetical protein
MRCGWFFSGKRHLQGLLLGMNDHHHHRRTNKPASLLDFLWGIIVVIPNLHRALARRCLDDPFDH